MQSMFMCHMRQDKAAAEIANYCGVGGEMFHRAIIAESIATITGCFDALERTSWTVPVS
jgi:hypothetical protein